MDIELKFADSILYESEPVDEMNEGFIFDRLTVTNALLKKLPGTINRVKVSSKPTKPLKETHQSYDFETFIPANQLEKRLELIKNWR
jgi:ATP-dependent Clp protease protease subunit